MQPLKRLARPGVNLALGAALALGLGAPCAQPQSSPAPASGVTCLSRPYVDANGSQQQLTIYVPADESAAYAAKGFTAVACAGASASAYRTETCRIAHLGNDAVQNRLTQVLGARPSDLCRSAQRAAPFPETSGG